MLSLVSMQRSWKMLALATTLFTAGFAIANRFQLTHGVLYRLAANDWANAAGNFVLLAIQALALWGALFLLGRKMLVTAMALAFVSIVVNLGYGQTVNDLVSTGTLSWMAAEARQAGNAAGEFLASLLFAGLQAILAIALFVGARLLFERGRWLKSGSIAGAAGVALVLAPSLLAVPFGLSASAAERNLYSLGYEVAMTEPPPPRDPVDLEPDTRDAPRHIVWLVDESVAYRQFQEIVTPSLAGIEHVDFGKATSLGHCSAPSNLALRSGVDVRQAGPEMDLRRTPSIWGYARKAGYRTVLIDGQTSGVPQNLLLPPELALIDEVIPASASIDTDRAIAARINRQLLGEDRIFTYAVLRGVHFQYRDHYPEGLIPADSSKLRQYETAVAYSKRDFFESLLEDADRSEVAVIYTSDHGQNLTEGAVPHCSSTPIPAELHVPLVAFLPDRLAARYAGATRSGHAASQMFSATLIWMGYDSEAVERKYDRDLTGRPARYVRFDRKVVPLRSSDAIDVAVSRAFPD